MSNKAHDQFATPSWQGKYDVYDVGPGEDLKLLRIQLDLATTDLTLNDTMQFIKLSSNTVVLGGWMTHSALDTGSAIVVDIGYDPDTAAAVADFFVNGTAGATKHVPFEKGIGAAGAPFVSADGDDYFITGLIQTAPTTAQAGTISVSLLLGNKGMYV